MSVNDSIIFGSTDDGFIPRQLADIQRLTNEDLALITDPRSGQKPFQNATDDTILQQVVAILAEAIANTENAAHLSFFARDPLTAVGVALSALVQLNAIIRKPGAQSIIPLTLTGTPSTLIPAGSQIGHEGSDAVFYLHEDVVLPLSGTLTVRALSTEKGPFDPEPGTVVSILTPVPGWDEAVNGSTLSVGSYEETDAALRARQQLSTNHTAYRHIEAIRAAVHNVPGVTFARGYQNSSLVTDERGIPGKTLAMVVVGGDDTEIANAILYREAVGLRYYGNTAVTIYDDMQVGTTVLFTRPVERLISVRVNLEIVIDEKAQKFPSNGDALIKKAIVEFSLQGHTVCEPYGNVAFHPGQDIIRSYLYTPINSIGGARVTSLELAMDGGSFAERDIILPWNEVGIFSEDRIEVHIS